MAEREPRDQRRRFADESTDRRAAAGGTNMENLRAAAAKMDKPAKSYATGFGVKFDAKFQNTRAFPTVVQWQSGKVVTVYPTDAAQPHVKLVNLPRK